MCAPVVPLKLAIYPSHTPPKAGLIDPGSAPISELVVPPVTKTLPEGAIRIE